MTRKILHISDIHFGRVDYATVKPLIAAVNKVAPDLIVVSGDLTQRARASEFKEAREFLDALPMPQLVVPGNHDVPLYDVVSRFAAPLRNYRRYIDDDLQPKYADDEMIVLGLNTARSLTWKNGRLNESQVDAIRRTFCGPPAKAVKILVTHHPLDLPHEFDDDALVGGAAAAMKAIAECGVDVLLAGHYHIAHTGDTTTRYPIDGFSALVVQSGTSTSARLRDEPNSFNLLQIRSRTIIIDRYTWRPSEGVFESLLSEEFHRSAHGWVRTATEVPIHKIVSVPDVAELDDP